MRERRERTQRERARMFKVCLESDENNQHERVTRGMTRQASNKETTREQKQNIRERQFHIPGRAFEEGLLLEASSL